MSAIVGTPRTWRTYGDDVATRSIALRGAKSRYVSRARRESAGERAEWWMNVRRFLDVSGHDKSHSVGRAGADDSWPCASLPPHCSRCAPCVVSYITSPMSRSRIRIRFCSRDLPAIMSAPKLLCTFATASPSLFLFVAIAYSSPSLTRTIFPMNNWMLTIIASNSQVSALDWIVAYTMYD